jgi:hypothetical protein
VPAGRFVVEDEAKKVEESGKQIDLDLAFDLTSFSKSHLLGFSLSVPLQPRAAKHCIRR